MTASRLAVGAFFLFLLIAFSAGLCKETETFEVTFTPENLSLKHYQLGENSFDFLEIPDLAISGKPGEPCLPVKSIHFYVPRGKRIASIIAKPVVSYDLPGAYTILPRQNEIPLGTNEIIQPVMPDPKIYNLAEPYPAQPVKLASQGSMGGRKIAGIEVFPIQYVPKEQRIVFNERLSIEVTLEPSLEESQLPLETSSVRKLRNDIVSKLVINPADLETDFSTMSGDLSPEDAAEYLIICLEQHADEYEVLKDWKTQKGIPAKIVTQQDVLATYPGTDEPEQIRNCIIDYYQNHSTVWVLLTLSAPKAKIRGCYCRVGGTIDTGIPCDLYFADVDGDWNADGDSYWGETTDDVDLYPDVYVGRIPANKGLQCSTVVHKILTYEGCYPVPTDYQLKMLFLAEYADESTDGAVSKNMIDNESVPPRYDPITKLYESSGNLNYTSAMNALNSGMAIVNHDGHGNANLISIGPAVLTTDDARSLTNAPRYSILYTVACIPGNFENVMGCFGRGFIEAENGGGFFIGNSRYGWYWPGNPGYGTGDLFDREFFKSLFVRDYDHLGVVHADAKVQRIPWSGDNNTDRWTQYTCNLFGDPETPVWKDIPLTMNVDYPESIDAGSQTVTVTATSDGSALEDARVCAWMDSTVYEVTYTASDGTAQLALAPLDTGTILLTVTKNGYLPYLGDIRVIEGTSGLVVETTRAKRLLRVLPNPVTSHATIAYRAPGSAEKVSLSIYDASGRLVRKLKAKTSSSSSIIMWDGCLENGERVPAGVYFVRATSGNTSAGTKFVVLR